MSGFALPGEMKAERGRGRIEEQPRWRKQTLLRDEPLQRFISPNWATVLAVIGTGIVRWLSAAVRLMTGIRCHGSEIRRGSRRDSVATDSGGGGWFGCWLSGVGLLDWRNSARTTEAFFVGADGVSVQAAAQGLGVEANRQTLRNRELGQLGQRFFTKSSAGWPGGQSRVTPESCPPPARVAHASRTSSPAPRLLENPACLSAAVATTSLVQHVSRSDGGRKRTINAAEKQQHNRRRNRWSRNDRSSAEILTDCRLMLQTISKVSFIC